MSESGRKADDLGNVLSRQALALLGLDHERGLHRVQNADCPLCRARRGAGKPPT
jgi:hypothetical protein